MELGVVKSNVLAPARPPPGLLKPVLLAASLLFSMSSDFTISTVLNSIATICALVVLPIQLPITSCVYFFYKTLFSSDKNGLLILELAL